MYQSLFNNATFLLEQLLQSPTSVYIIDYMTFPDINPIIISFGPLAVSWYSLSYVVGILLGWVYANKIIASFPLGITKKHLEDFVTWAILGIIIGGRLGHVVFYDPVRYLSDPVSILMTYKGGMSFHGGTVGVIFASYFFSQKYKINYLTLCDILVTVSPIGLCLGRIANFINTELYGRVTSMPWGVVFPGVDMNPRHPSQLYEAFFEGLILLLILAITTFKYKSIKTPSLNFSLFLIFYSLFRIFIEMFREPDINIGYIVNCLTMGQILSILMLLVGIYLLGISLRNTMRVAKRCHTSESGYPEKGISGSKRLTGFPPTRE